MNFRLQKKNNNFSSIDFTPIVDTVFNLIIFFALSLNFIGTPAIKLKLPQASSEETVREKNEIRIYITKGVQKEGYTYGNFIIDGNNFSLEDIEKLINQRAVNKETIVIIQADESVSQGEVVKIMDMAKSAGLERIAIATKPKEK
ncbi:MAG: biopolymer transporter ExbD [Proteobacteria bacterium]|nr:biopolymer transporter ExbD [Pseudomonadota bacterium]